MSINAIRSYFDIPVVGVTPFQEAVCCLPIIGIFAGGAAMLHAMNQSTSCLKKLDPEKHHYIPAEEIASLRNQLVETTRREAFFASRALISAILTTVLVALNVFALPPFWLAAALFVTGYSVYTTHEDLKELPALLRELRSH